MYDGTSLAVSQSLRNLKRHLEESRIIPQRPDGKDERITFVQGSGRNSVSVKMQVLNSANDADLQSAQERIRQEVKPDVLNVYKPPVTNMGAKMGLTMTFQMPSRVRG